MRNYVLYDPNDKEIRIRGLSISRLKNVFYVSCPNSLKEAWANEIKKNKN